MRPALNVTAPPYAARREAGELSILMGAHAGSRLSGGARSRGGVIDNLFWGTVSLALLGTLVGVLVLMITEDVHRAMTQRRH